jgi:uncharacterized protein YggE
MKNQETSEYVKMAAAAALIMVTVFLIAATINQIKTYSTIVLNDPSEASRVITVTGHSDVTATPDTAVFSWTVSQTGSTTQDAQDKAATIGNKALAYLKQNGVADADITNQGYNTTDNYENVPCYQNAVAPVMVPGSNGGAVVSPAVPAQPCGQQQKSGFITTQTVQVKVHNVTQGDAQVGKLVAGLGALSVQTNDVQYTFDDPTGVQQQARIQAIADARKQADSIADALGVKINRVLSFNENYGGSVYPMAYAMGAMGATDKAAVAPVIPVGDQKISEDVTVTFSLK